MKSTVDEIRQWVSIRCSRNFSRLGVDSAPANGVGQEVHRQVKVKTNFGYCAGGLSRAITHSGRPYRNRNSGVL